MFFNLWNLKDMRCTFLLLHFLFFILTACQIKVKKAYFTLYSFSVLIKHSETFIEIDLKHDQVEIYIEWV